MAEDGKVLAQDDIDSLFSSSDESEESEEPTEKPLMTSEKKPKEYTVEDVTAWSSQLYNMANLKREENVKVIWNALGTLPMTSGFSIKIEGMEYTSLGVLHENHLVVRSEE
ncbi:MAG: hypothetical protein JRJ02_02210 [Deltaproteobacteria bacterium]|nr:hypothetical protein [Deltaproteobacteria bacterium]